MERLRKGLWHWKARHPEWEPSEPWDPNVSSYAVDDGQHLLLLDPLDVPSELLALAPERETAIVLSAPWHERSAQNLVEQLGAPVYTPLPDTAEDLIRMFGITAEQAGNGAPDLVWLLREHKGEAHPYKAGASFPFGIEAYPGHRPNDMLLWIPSHQAVLSGDTIVDFGQGIQINERWLRWDITLENVIERLRSLLDLPIEHLLLTHGGPTDRAALERLISD
jgi:glyoxylase-like metal-dependent hydrolase (beta-lactamase superfamily II)